MLTPVLATLAYVVSADGGSVLLLHRNKRPDDIHYGKHVGLGGRIERDEDVDTAARREIFEESGLIARRMLLRGTISWPGFGRGGQDWFGFIFRVDSFTGDPHSGNHEGTLRWVPLPKLPRQPMWESDRLWLPMVFDAEPATFHGHMPYSNGEMRSWSFTRN